MIIDGEKWACEACVRGHRVSNCQHADRPLQHINKKGRPVSQCHHCRTMRKSRASHVKCDCGEKSHKCAHLKTAVEGHRDSCCCNHGGRCTCSHKKEAPSLDPVPESDSDEQDTTTTSRTSRASSGGAASKAAPPRSRRRANTIHSDSMLSFDENGRHKPTYKTAKSKCEPYPLKRVNSMHTAGSLAASGGESSARGATAGREPGPTRRVRSEKTSPLMTGSSSSPSSFAQLNGQLPPLDLSAIEYPRYQANGFDMFGNLSDAEQPMFSAGLSAASVDWSHYDGLDFGSGSRGGAAAPPSNGGGGDSFTPSSYGQAQSYGGSGGGAFEFNGSEQAPTLTTTTSGDVSEVEDFLGPSSADDFDVSGAFGAPGGHFGISPPHSGGGGGGTDLGATTAAAAAAASLSFGEDEFAKLPKEATLAASASFADDPLFWMGDYSQGLPAVSDATDPNNLFWES